MKKLAVINGLRGYAILGVIYFHLIGVFLNQPGWVTYYIGSIPVFPLTYLGHGWLGVDLFFILSGFVLYLPYATNKRKLETKNDLWNFYKARATRLLPLYYIVLIVSIIFVVKWSNVQEPIFWRTILLMFTATFNFAKDTFIPQCNYVLWSLGIEILFSIAFPFLIKGIAKNGIMRFCMYIFYMSFIVRMVSTLFPEYNVAAHLNMIKDSLFGRMDDFIVGMLICHWYVTKWKQEWFEKNSMALFIVSFIVITLGCYFSDYVFLHIVSHYYEPLINTVFQFGFGTMLIALLYMRKNILKYLFTNKFLQLSGMMCYSLYVWHGNMRMVFMADYSAIRIITYCVFLFALAFLSYRYIEFGNKELKDILPE